MALSKQATPTRNLNVFLAWAAAAGYRVGEHPDYGGVTAVHVQGSWHYEAGAGDINWGVANPAGERTRLLFALEVAESMGLALTFARDGVVGSAANHRNHLHVDVGTYSNYGRGNVHRLPGDLVVWKVQGCVYGDLARRDNLWGPDTSKRLHAVRMASSLHGERFPYGVEYTQRIVGTADDGEWGDQSKTAHDRTVAQLQRALGVHDDGVWGPITEAAFQRARKTYRR